MVEHPDDTEQQRESDMSIDYHECMKGALGVDLGQEQRSPRTIV